MIPDQYWKLLLHWWWLIGLVFVLAIFSALTLHRHDRFNTYETKVVLEVKQVYLPDGTVSFDVAQRQAAAVRLARDLAGPWLGRRLMDALEQEGEALVPTGLLEVNVSGPQPPDRREVDLRPPVIEITIRSSDPNNLAEIARVAALVYSEFVVERQTELLGLRQQDLDVQVNNLEGDLREVLAAKREAINTERTEVQGAVETLLLSHEKVLQSLPILLDDFRRQVGLSNVGLLADPGSLDDAMNDLREEVVLLQLEWQTNLRPALDILYSAEAQPDYQIASNKEEVLREAFLTAFKRHRILLENTNPDNIVAVLEPGTTPLRVSTIGVGMRTLLGAAGMMGLVSGWVLANLGEYILIARRSRRFEEGEIQLQPGLPSQAPAR